MIRVRKLVLAIAAATSLTSGMAHALGLGEISLKSSLNQQLYADIELLEIQGLDKAEIIPRLASAEDFSKAGVERDFFLTDLKFTPVIMSNGRGAIRVTSGKPVREPYLNFLVEVVWPSGRVLREYTLLLDPPLYSPETAVAAAPNRPVAVSAPRPVSAPVAAPRPQSGPIDGPFKAGTLSGSPVVAPVRAQSQPTAALSGDQYKTNSRDTLWGIARRVPAAGSLNQTMLAIQDLNPNAFIGGNINSLKSGQVLRLPDAAQINARSALVASAEVAEQNSAWREGRSLAPVAAPQMDATKRDVAGDAPAQIEAQDSLRLVADDAGNAAAGADNGTGENSQVLTDKLAVSQESLDTSRRQGEELQQNVSDLQSQMDKLQKLVELKDDQLAKLQADLLAQQKQAAQAALQTQSEPVIPLAPVAGEIVSAEPSSAPVVATAEVAEDAEVKEAAVAEVPAAETAPAATPAQPMDTTEEAPAETVQAPAEAKSPAVANEIQPVQLAAATDVKPVVSEPVSLMDEFLGNPLMLGAGGAGLLIILLGLMALSRRNEAEGGSVESKPLDLQDDDFSRADAELTDEVFAGLDDYAVEPEKAPVTAHVADALSEAEGYIAYGKFNQAAESLQDAINKQPQRADLQLKLMEVMAELGDRDGFQRQATELQELGGFSSQVEQINARYPAMAAASFALGVGSVASSEPGDSTGIDLLSEAPLVVPQDMDDAFDLSLEDLDGLDSQIDEEFREAALVSEQVIDDFSLDTDFAEPAGNAKDNLDFGLILDEPAASLPTSALEQMDDFSDFDFDLEGDPALIGAGDTAVPMSSDNEISFELPELEVSLGINASEESFLLDSALELTEDFDLPVAAEQPLLEPVSSETGPTLETLNSELDQLGASFDEFSLKDEPELLQARTDLNADDDEDFDFLSGTDEIATKLDLARAYIDMGDAEGARDILGEVIAEGSEAQQQEARELIGTLV